MLISLSLKFIKAQGGTPPGPLHQRSESQELHDLVAPPTGNRSVPSTDFFVGLAVDPTNGNNSVLLFESSFLFTSDNGAHWATDYIANPGTFSYPVGVSYDRSGHSYIALQEPARSSDDNSANLFPSRVGIVQGFSDGAYLSNVPTVAATASCGFDPHSCQERITAIGIVTDQSGTATDGTTWIYYLLNCQDFFDEGCEGYIPGNATVLLATASRGPGQPFGFLSGSGSTFLNVSGAGAVIDSSGEVHFIYTDLGQQPTITLALDSYPSPLVQYSPADHTNRFVISYTPSCASRGLVAYCAFNAGSIGTGPPQSHLNVYLAKIDLRSGTATISLVNNDPPGKGKDHFHPSAAVTPNGDIYVGFFDDRRSATNTRLDYFLARSVDGGQTFPMQQPINQVSFPSLSFAAGAIAAGPDGVVRAAYATSFTTYFTSVAW